VHWMTPRTRPKDVIAGKGEPADVDELQGWLDRAVTGTIRRSLTGAASRPSTSTKNSGAAPTALYDTRVANDNQP
jgi:hypothetical protein